MAPEPAPPAPPDESTLAGIEDTAVRMARRAGQTLMGYFGSSLEVRYKDERKTDPVTNADREVQDDLVRAISEAYPGHGIVGEEDDEDAGDWPAPDYVWVVDPLDGTKNFMNGLPVFASSIGVLYRGAPVAGAVYIPWPGTDEHNRHSREKPAPYSIRGGNPGAGAGDGFPSARERRQQPCGGLVLHARRGGGAYAGGERISLPDDPEPVQGRLTTLPGSFRSAFRFDAPMKGRTGELRVTGSIVYELAMAARGVLQYSFTGAPHLWDAAAGVVLVAEAGGLVMMGERRRSRIPLVSDGMEWSELDSFFPDWDEGMTLAHMRRWRSPLLCGSPRLTRYVAQNLRAR